MNQELMRLEGGRSVYLECSAQNKEGVREVFETATKAALLQVKSIYNSFLEFKLV